MSQKSFVEQLVRNVVEHPDEIEIEEEEDHHTRTYYVRCNPDDVGKIIGKSGRVISTIRLVVSAVASKQRERAYVRVVTE
jgi:predicted RNA-binding protein YlqC (UPF0109 family)